MIKSFKNFFGRRDPRQEAGLALARLLSQLDLQDMPFDNGVQQNRRNNTSRNVAIGVWLMPLGAKQDPADANFDNPMPAVTADLRRLGVGLLMPLQLPAPRVILAFADSEDLWKFFVCTVRHNSPRPGGWFKVGLAVEGVWEPEPLQVSRFRRRIQNAFGPPESE